MKNDRYSCQLILGKSKIVPEGMSLPRAELYAAVLNVHVTEIVKRSLKERCVSSVLVMDSEIALHWLDSDTKQLKPWTRNKVIEANRFSKKEDRFHIESSMNPADAGTRKSANIESVGPDSEWIKGKPWMLLPLSELRSCLLRSVEDIKYRKEQLQEIKKESVGPAVNLCDSGFSMLVADSKTPPSKSNHYLVDNRMDYLKSKLHVKVKERLLFSGYLLDPNEFKFNKVIRIMAFVIKFVKQWMILALKRTLNCYSYVIGPTDSVSVNRLILEKIVC